MEDNTSPSRNNYYTLQPRSGSQTNRNVTSTSRGARWASPESDKSEPRIIDSRNNSNVVDSSSNIANNISNLDAINSNRAPQLNGIITANNTKELTVEVDPVS